MTDQMTTTATSSAVTLAERFGWSLTWLPLAMKHDPGWHKGDSWAERATSDPEEIGRWPEESNFAVPARRNGLLILDEDQADALSDAGVNLPPTFTVETTNGHHYYFSADRDSGFGQGNVWPGVDVRWDGYVVGPGSVHPDSGALYTLVDDRDPAPVPPDVAAALLEAAQRSDEAEPVSIEEIENLPATALTPAQEGYVRAGVEGVLKELDELSELSERQRNGQDQGWDSGTFHKASRLLELRNAAPQLWSLGEIRDQFLDRAPCDGSFPPHRAVGKWNAALRKKGVRAADLPTPRPEFNLTSEPYALDALCAQIGKPDTPLAEMYRRGGGIVHVAPTDEDGEDSGPAQVQAVSSTLLASRMNRRYDVVRYTNGTQTKPPERVRATLRKQLAELALGDLEGLPSLRRISGITHTPTVRADGSILTGPGYDAGTKMLYLPDRGLHVPEVPDEPTKRQVMKAGKLLLTMIDGFPFVTPHDRANYIGAMLTPLLRRLTPPPYKMLAVDAPQPASGKSMLADLLMILHGGHKMQSMPGTEAEMRKVLTSVLMNESAPVVTFDNVDVRVDSPSLAGTLTSAAYSDRVLGSSRTYNGVNDRLWVATGNNIRVGGDLPRRLLWVRIDANSARPQERTFTINNLRDWARAHRGRLLAALLTITRAWVVAGRPTAALQTTDDYGQWAQVVNGILRNAFPGDDRIGNFNSPENEKGNADESGNEHLQFLTAMHDKKGSDTWYAKDAANGALIDLDYLPERDDGRPWTPKGFGRWLSAREDRFVGSYVLRGDEDRKGVNLWHVERRTGPSQEEA